MNVFHAIPEPKVFGELSIDSLPYREDGDRESYKNNK